MIGHTEQHAAARGQRRRRAVVVVALPLLTAVLLVLVYTRNLSGAPPGLLDAEAANGLLAREATGNGRALLDAPSAPTSPLLAAVITIVGRMHGFDIATARLGAALVMLAAAAATGLWAHRLLGRPWGLVAAVALAGSLWPLLLGRLALGPAAGALVVALTGATLQTAVARAPAPASAMRWYAAAGLAIGLGPAADPVGSLLPLALVPLWLAALRGRDATGPAGQTRRTGALLATIVALLIAAPHVAVAIAGHAAPPLSLDGSGRLVTARGILTGYAEALGRMVAPDNTTPPNLPRDPLIGPALLPWVIAGPAVALRRASRQRIILGGVGALALLLPAALTDPVDPGHLLPLLPPTIVGAALGMHAAVSRLRSRRWRPATAILIALSLIVTIATSGHAYRTWARAPETASAFAASLPAALEAATSLPPGDIVLVSAGEHRAVVAYLGAGIDNRHDFDGRLELPIPLERDGYLIVPAAAPIDPALLAVLGSIEPSAATGAYRIYRLDDRMRDALPLAVPTVPYGDGSRFLGHRLTAAPDGALALVLAWELPAGSGEEPGVRVRLRTAHGHDAEVVVPALRPTTLDQPADVLQFIRLPAPAAGTTVDLEIALIAADGRPVAAPGTDPNGYLFLNRYAFQAPGDPPAGTSRLRP